jgi:hypothetical protein
VDEALLDHMRQLDYTRCDLFRHCEEKFAVHASTRDRQQMQRCDAVVLIKKWALRTRFLPIASNRVPTTRKHPTAASLLRTHIRTGTPPDAHPTRSLHHRMRRHVGHCLCWELGIASGWRAARRRWLWDDAMRCGCGEWRKLTVRSHVTVFQSIIRRDRVSC